MLVSKKDLRLIYIAGAYRSGSTILDEILGEGKNCFSVGELRQIWKTFIKKGGLCSCGLNYKRCPFWSQVLKLLFGSSEVSPQTLENLIKMQKIIERIPLFSKNKRQKYLKENKEAIESYSQLLEKIYLIAQEISGAKILIDSTKDPHYLFLFRNFKNIDLYLLHLVRDSRAVSFSWKRKKYNPATKDYMKIHHPYTSSLMWLKFNKAILKFKKESNFPYYRLRYEDFVSSPFKEITAIEKAFNMEGVFPKINNSIKLNQKHLVAGNPVMFSSKNLVLKLDNAWIYNMKFRHKLLVTFMTAPLLKIFGYPLKFW